MKYLTHILLLMLVLPVSLKAGRPKADTSVCLVMTGKISNAGDREASLCKVELLLDNTVIDSLFLKGKKKFSFALKRNRHYIIRMSKPGYISKNICVHTTVPAGQTEQFDFEFETTLLSEKPNITVDPESRNLPVASIYFHAKKQTFYYHKAFSSYYQKQLCKSYQENNL